jgi:hypothetical protein
MLANFILLDQRSLDLIRFQYDQRVSARVYLARILRLQGFPDEAIRTAKGAVDEARESNHALSLCYALLGAAWTMLWVEDLAAAERYIVMLLDHSARLGLALWRAWVRIFQEVLVIRRYDFGPGLRQLRAAFDEFGSAMSDWISAMFLTELAAGFARAGQIADGLAAAEQAIERAEQTEARWLFSEHCASRASFFSRKPQRGQRGLPRITFGRRSTGRAGKTRCPGNCVPPRA